MMELKIIFLYIMKELEFETDDVNKDVRYMIMSKDKLIASFK